jgi:hypothetical protein
MFDKPQSSHVLGLDIDGFSLKGVVLSLVHGKMSFDQAFDFILETEKEKEENVKRLYIPEKKSFLRKSYRKQFSCINSKHARSLGSTT